MNKEYRNITSYIIIPLTMIMCCTKTVLTTNRLNCDSFL